MVGWGTVERVTRTTKELLLVILGVFLGWGIAAVVFTVMNWHRLGWV